MLISFILVCWIHTTEVPMDRFIAQDVIVQKFKTLAQCNEAGKTQTNMITGAVPPATYVCMEVKEAK